MKRAVSILTCFVLITSFMFIGGSVKAAEADQWNLQQGGFEKNWSIAAVDSGVQFTGTAYGTIGATLKSAQDITSIEFPITFNTIGAIVQYASIDISLFNSADARTDNSPDTGNAKGITFDFSYDSNTSGNMHVRAMNKDNSAFVTEIGPAQGIDTTLVGKTKIFNLTKDTEGSKWVASVDGNSFDIPFTLLPANTYTNDKGYISIAAGNMGADSILTLGEITHPTVTSSTSSTVDEATNWILHDNEFNKRWDIKKVDAGIQFTGTAYGTLSASMKDAVDVTSVEFPVTFNKVGDTGAYCTFAFSIFNKNTDKFNTDASVGVAQGVTFNINDSSILHIYGLNQNNSNYVTSIVKKKICSCF
jgi:hypothetical protein